MEEAKIDRIAACFFYAAYMHDVSVVDISDHLPLASALPFVSYLKRNTFSMVKLFLLIWPIGLALSVYSQESNTPQRFKDPVFDKIQVQKNIPYWQDTAPGTKKKNYYFDLYEPTGDVSAARPLIIWLHGGGFKFGKKTSGGLPLWSRTFAQRGYVCVAANYRLSKKHPLKHFEDLVEGCADAVADIQKAVQFFKAHALQYRIDTGKIILGGNSAGGMIALQSVYSSQTDMAKLIHRGDSVAAPVYNPQHIAAVINYWGALFSLNWLQHAKTPIVSVHGSKDRVVPVNDRKPPLYGSLAIHAKADSLHIPNRIKIFEGYGHELQKHFNPLFAGHAAKKRWLEAGQFTADFLYNELFNLR